MKRLLFLLMVVLAVGVMAGLVNAQEQEEPTLLVRAIADGDDDVEERQTSPPDGEMDRGSSDLELGYDGSDKQIIGLLFNDIQIPPGATIMSATVRFIADEPEDDPVYVTIWGRLDDLGDSFTATVWSLSTPGIDDETTATVEWTLVGPDTYWAAGGDEVFTPDISSIIQEIIDQPTWTPGRNLVLAFGNTNSEGITMPDQQRRAASYNDAPGNGAVLNVEYTMYTATNPLPEDGDWDLVNLERVGGSLQWQRPEPLTDGDTVLVNVYFSTDPNLIPGKGGTQLVVENYDGDSTDQFGIPLTLDTDYYWRVDCIDPNGGLGDVITKGTTWTFVTTVPPAVLVSKTALSVSEEGETSDTYNISLSKSPGSDSVTVAMPAFPTVLDIPIVGGNNDAEENMAANGTIDVGSSDLELGWDGGEDQIVGLRFQDIMIPAGATITSATVTFTTDRGAGTEDEDCYLTIWGRLDDPGAFTGTAYDLSTPTIADETTAEVEWTMLESDTASHWTAGQATASSTSPDITTIIQEIIDEMAWGPGNALVVLFGNGNSQGKAGSGSQRRAESFDGSSALAATLHIEFDMGAGQWPVSWIPSEVVLTDANWELGEDITVTAIDDTISETDPHTFTLKNAASSASTDWDGLPVDDVVVYISENDCGAWGFVFGDLNEDCVVDLADLAEFALQFGLCTDPHFPAICGDVR